MRRALDFMQLRIAIGLCQLLYPMRRLLPGPYRAASEVHLDLLATWLSHY